MSGIPRIFIEHVMRQSSLDSSLQGLAEFIQDPNGQQQYSVNIACIDLAQEPTQVPQLWRIDPGDGHDICSASANRPLHSPSVQLDQKAHEDVRTKKMTEITTIPDNVQGRIIIIEDIDRHAIAYLEMRYNLPLSFFATYLTTELSETEHDPKPPCITLAPSKVLEYQSMHLQYQRVVDVGIMEQRKKLYFRSNVRRLVKPTPLLNKRCPGLARGCCSLYVLYDEKEKWICIILVDATNAEVATTDTAQLTSSKLGPPQRTDRRTSGIPDLRTWGGAQKVQPSQEQFHSCVDADLQNSNSLLHSLIRHFYEASGVTENERLGVLSFAYFPIQLVIAEWMQYALLLSRYVKHYEYALISPNVGLKQSKVKELLPWRRRCIRSGHKLELLRRSIKHHAHDAESSEFRGFWGPILEDIDHVSSQIAEWATFLNSMVPLMDSHQSLVEAQSVRHLTYVVLAFSSLSLIASIFSMSENVLPWGGGHIWLYFAVAVPFTMIVLGSYFCFSTILGRSISVRS